MPSWHASAGWRSGRLSSQPDSYQAPVTEFEHVGTMRLYPEQASSRGKFMENPLEGAQVTKMTGTRFIVGLGLVCVMAAGVATQERRLASPAGGSAAQIGGDRYDARAGNVGGRWVEIRYGRPIKRARDIFGPDDYREFLNDGAPVWRAGANVTTRLITEAPLVFGDTSVPAGEYTVFIDLQPSPWVLVLSTWPAQTTYDYENQEALFGAYGYTPDRDLVRLPMTHETLAHSFEQLSWQFLDMTDEGGTLALLWDTTLVSVPFTLGK